MSASVHQARRPPVVFDVVVVAASQGAIPLYREVFGRLDAQLPCPVVLVQHRRPGDDLLVDVLRARTPLAVRASEDDEALRPGTVYVASSDRQPRFTAPGRIAHAPLEPRGRVTADAVFTSAAAAHGARVLAVVLSGRLDDGAAGARAVKAAGGRVVVQDPQTALQPSMPSAALVTGCVDACLPPRSVADAINAFVTVPGTAELFASRPSPWAWRAA